MRAARSYLGAALAALYAAAFVVAYWLCAQEPGQFLADLWLALAAIPYILTIRALERLVGFLRRLDRRGAGGGGVLLRSRLCRGALIEALLRGGWRLATRRGRR